jgi:hypothetical protein
MNLSEKLDNLRKLFKLELGITYTEEFILVKGFVNLKHSDYDMFRVETHSSWMKKYLLKRYYCINGGKLKSEVTFDDSILFSDPIENFDDYYKSKSGINKFKL